MLEYWVRVYVPFQKDSYSNYESKTERKLQLLMWTCSLLGSAVLGFHLVNLFQCNDNIRYYMCTTLLYQWGLYGGLLGLAGFLAMLLHYGYVDPNYCQDDVDSVLEEIRTEWGSQLEEVSIADDDEF